MAKRNRHHKRHFTLPIAIIAGFVPAIIDIKNSAANGGWPNAIMHTTAGLFGWDTNENKWAGVSQMKAAGTFPILLGFGVHLLASKLGLNRMLGRVGIPVIRI